MDAKGIILTGTSASGKTSIQRILCNRYQYYKKVKSVTTRKQRPDDRLGDYNFISNEEFLQLKCEGSLMIETEYRGEQYGITKHDIQGILEEGKIPILLITPKSVEQISENYANTYGHMLSFFIDASDELLDRRLIDRDGVDILDSLQVKKQRKEDRKYIKLCNHYRINIFSVETSLFINCLFLGME